MIFRKDNLKEHINITERDIYNFVFSPETLEPAKKTYLESNLEKFQRQIDYCRQLKEISLEEPQGQSIINVVDRILSPKGIELIPEAIDNESKDSKLRLAAFSFNLNKKNYTYSFTDSNSEHVVKIIMSGSRNLLYFFSLIPMQKVTVTFLPSEATYNIQDTSKPIEILEEKEIEKIIITQT